MIKLTFILSGLFLFISCGKDTKLPGQRSEKVYYIEPAEHENYSYEFVTKSCTTGTRSFKTLVDACEGLTNEKINNECAFEQRKELFENSSCAGSF